MGSVYADIDIYSWGDIFLQQSGYLKEEQIRKVKVNALVDSGSYMLAINEDIKKKLGLQTIHRQTMELANGSKEDVDIVGPVDVRFENRRCSCDAVVLSGNNEVLLGAIPMEDLDVVIDPKQQKLVVNPESPLMAKKKMKKFRTFRL
ncbi:MAG: hypothetical protein HW421_1679 [Ignavibacteria bacterium]|nr:hypothetical protein [Ignavibacteria bacterium]